MSSPSEASPRVVIEFFEVDAIDSAVVNQQIANYSEENQIDASAFYQGKKVMMANVSLFGRHASFIPSAVYRPENEADKLAAISFMWSDIAKTCTDSCFRLYGNLDSRFQKAANSDGGALLE